MGRLPAAILLLPIVCACVRGGKASPDAGPAPSTLPPEAAAWLAEGLPREWPAPRRGGEARVWLSYEPATLNALVESGYAQRAISLSLVQEGLLRIDPRDPERVLPALAEKVLTSADGLVTTATLAAARYSDGAAVSADDVVFSLAAAKDPKNLSDLAGLLEPLDRAEALDARTVRLRWKRPYAFVEQALSLLPVVPKAAFPSPAEVRASAFSRAPIGTGPYRLENWQPNERIVLVRNDLYRGKAPLLDRVVFRRATPEIALELLAKGELDVIHTVYNEQQFAGLSRDPGVRERFRAFAFHDGSYMSLMLRSDRGALADVRVRRALALSFDYQAHARAVGMGLPRVVSCPLYEGSPDCDPAVAPPHRDLAAAGRPTCLGERIPLDLVVPSHWRVPTFEIFQRDVAAAGFEVSLTRVDPAAASARFREGSFDLGAWLQWGFFDPARRWRSGAPENFTRYGSPEADAILDALSRERDPARRHKQARAFHRRFAQDVPQLLLWSRPWLSVVSRRLAGVYPSREFFRYDEWWLAERPSL
jgi:peptide/nickel transport system substrate-binding protein